MRLAFKPLEQEVEGDYDLKSSVFTDSAALCVRAVNCPGPHHPNQRVSAFLVLRASRVRKGHCLRLQL
jgi:hypothetical protein